MVIIMTLPSHSRVVGKEKVCSPSLQPPIHQNRTDPCGEGNALLTSTRVLLPPVRMNISSANRTSGSSSGLGLCLLLDSLDCLIEIQPFLQRLEQSSRGDVAVIGLVLEHGSTDSSNPKANSSYSSDHSGLVAHIARRQHTSWRAYHCSCTGSSWLSKAHGWGRCYSYFRTGGMVGQE